MVLARRRWCSLGVVGALVAASLAGCPQLREDDFSAIDTPRPESGGVAGSEGLAAGAGNGATSGGGAAPANGGSTGAGGARGGTAAVTGGAAMTGGVVTSGMGTTGGVEASGGDVTTGGAEVGGGSATGSAGGVGEGGRAGAASGKGGAADGGAASAVAGAGAGAGTGGESGSARAEAGSAGADSGPYCGDAVAGLDEECDGPDLRDLDCAARGYPGGSLRCDPSCHLDESSCTLDVACDFEATGATGTVFTGSTTGRTSAFRDHTCTVGGSGPDLSFSWVAPATRCYVLEVTSPNDIDTILAVFASCALEEELACADDGGFDQLSRLELEAVAGTPYAILVDSFYASDTGTVNVVVSPCW